MGGPLAVARADLGSENADLLGTHNLFTLGLKAWRSVHHRRHHR